MLKEGNFLASIPARQINMDDTNKVMIFERNNLLFVFNFHNEHSIVDYRFPSIGKGQYSIILDTDSPLYGGHGRIETTMKYSTQKDDMLSVYLPCRTALVMKKH
jgi:1,4-alpha-glucan branching enzyme